MIDPVRRWTWAGLAGRWIAIRYLAIILIANIAWETLHLPLYTIWATATAGYLAYVGIHCSLGDLMIGTAALLAAVVIAGRGWPFRHYGRVVFFTVLFGLAYTVFSEWLNTSVRGSWAYSASMPRVPPLGTGLSPILQWMIIPALSLLWARRCGQVLDQAPEGGGCNKG